MKALIILSILAHPTLSQAQRYAPVHFDSAAIAVSMSNDEYEARRDSIRNAGLSNHDQSATWTRYGEPGWTEHRDPQPNGTIFHYWDNDDPVYEHGMMIGIFWGLAIPDTTAGFVSYYRKIRWFWERSGEHAAKASAWYDSVQPDKP